MRPKRSLSQNYLQDPNIARKIAGMLRAADADHVVEVGPGRGMLTTFLEERFGERLTLVEVDAASVAWLRERFPALAPRIVEADFLKYPLPEGRVALIGNFPYHITSPIFFRVLEYRDRVTEVVAMVQREVAQRLAGRPGTKEYGLLSVLLQTFYEVKYLFTVGEQVFYPRPKVKSAVLRLERNGREKLPCDEEYYFRLVRQAFGQRRKTLRNALREMLPSRPLPEEMLGKRAEQLSPADYLELCRALQEQEDERTS